MVRFLLFIGMVNCMLMVLYRFIIGLMFGSLLLCSVCLCRVLVE